MLVMLCFAIRAVKHRGILSTSSLYHAPIFLACGEAYARIGEKDGLPRCNTLFPVAVSRRSVRLPIHALLGGDDRNTLNFQDAYIYRVSMTSYFDGVGKGAPGVRGKNLELFCGV